MVNYLLQDIIIPAKRLDMNVLELILRLRIH
jgi:hypothetical protein